MQTRTVSIFMTRYHDILSNFYIILVVVDIPMLLLHLMTIRRIFTALTTKVFAANIHFEENVDTEKVSVINWT